MSIQELYKEYMGQSFACDLNSLHRDTHEDGHKDDADTCIHGDRHNDED